MRFGIEDGFVRSCGLNAARAAIVLASATIQTLSEVAYCDSTGTWSMRLPAGLRLLRESSDAGPTGGIPPLPSGLCLQLGDDGGNLIERSTSALCRWQLQNADLIHGARVLELGAGSGASGLFAAALGASSVTITPGDEALVQVLEANARRNRGLLARGGSYGRVTATAAWRFGQSPPACIASLLPATERFDLVIGSGITSLVDEERDCLSITLHQLLESGLARRCVIAHEHRRADFFDVHTIVENLPAARWSEKDVRCSTSEPSHARRRIASRRVARPARAQPVTRDSRPLTQESQLARDRRVPLSTQGCLETFLASAQEHGLHVHEPLVRELGYRRAQPTGERAALVESTTDLSVFEVTLAGASNARVLIGGPLRPLAEALAPQKMVVECGGGGTCGPNSLGRVLAHANMHEGSGDDVRRRVVAHATKLVRSNAEWEPATGVLEAISVREFIENSFATWAVPGRNVNRVGGKFDWGGPRHLLSAERWLKHMADPTAWIDQAFLALAADCFAVEIQYHIISGKGEISHARVMEPRGTVAVLARVELAYVVDQHFCAIVPCTNELGGS